MKKYSLILALALFLTSVQMVWADDKSVSEESISNTTLEKQVQSEETSATAEVEASKAKTEDNTTTEDKNTSESTAKPESATENAEAEDLPHDFYRAGKSGKVSDGDDNDNDNDNDIPEEEPEEEPAPVQQKNTQPLSNISNDKKAVRIRSFIRAKNKSLSVQQRSDIANAVLKYSKKYNVRSSLIMAVIWKESTYSPTTKTGPCYGLMQIHSKYSGSGLSTKQMYSISINVDRGTRELSSYLKKYNGNEVLALTAYNWGIGNVARGTYNTKYANNVLAKEKKIIAYMSK
ncbi:transglycosylase SLT domain-containing protein [Filifactor villosus]|uniref:Transglycosylase SLT domain-containing protein n=1 Tax=Filifactor villosus TaxID=29374 RepID=A0ABV9QMB6_9FIRM